MALPKPPAQRQRRNDRGDVGILPAAKPGGIAPLPQQAWTRATVASWREYWASPVSSLVNRQSDLEAVYRMFDYRDELRRAMQAYRAQRVSIGSMGQPKPSPYLEIVARMEKMILPLEDRYGLSALARLRLGAQLGDATKSLAEMNALAYEPGEGDDDANESATVVDLPGLPVEG